MGVAAVVAVWSRWPVTIDGYDDVDDADADDDDGDGTWLPNYP